jgi:glycine/sarcosine N-methyltransferase
MGTQAIGFAASGDEMAASDLSEAAIRRAGPEANVRGMDISFLVSSMTLMPKMTESNFDVVAAMDNALPHLSSEQLRCAFKAMASNPAQSGLIIASIRHDDELLNQKPTVQPPAFYGGSG